MTFHAQVPVKVNALVDEGIVDLIKAMSCFPLLRTYESCEEESQDSKGKKPAIVFFSYGKGEDAQDRDWKEIAEFVLGYFGPELMVKFGDLVWITLTINTHGGVRGQLNVRPGIVNDVAKFIKELSLKYLKVTNQ